MLKTWHSKHLHSIVQLRPVLPLVRPQYWQTRSLLTLAIETSCDDTSVALLEKHDKSVSLQTNQPRAVLHFHEKVTSDNRVFQGVSPIQALESHQENLASLVRKATATYACQNGRSCRPDFISVTRGPGMRSSVSTGLDTAKGLAVAYDVPLVGVNHMQAHALTPRLVSALNGGGQDDPAFSFLSLLVSGGHTMLLHSESLTAHKILATTTDVAIGDALDKMARLILPEAIVAKCKDVSYARDLESFVFPTEADRVYTPPATRAQEISRKATQWGWSFPIPLAEIRGGQKAKAMEMSFSGVDSALRRILADRQTNGLNDEERRTMGYEAMRIAFEHVAGRTVFALEMLGQEAGSSGNSGIDTLVVSGGVAANRFMRHLFRKFLDIKGYSHIRLQFPPLEFCTDNAAMIAWAGMEMYEAGWESELSVRAVRKWSLDPNASDGGILGIGGWKRKL